MENKLLILDYINSHNNWEEILSKEPYNLIIKHKEPFVLLKYNQISSNMRIPEVQEARGLILKKVKDKYIVSSMRFSKFFNYEQDEAAKLDFTHPVEMSQKIDGSLIGVWYDEDDGWHISTSGNVDACDSELQFQTSYLKNYQDLFFQAFGDSSKFEKLNKDYTYIFELISPYNRVIVPYKKTELYLLSIRNNKTLEELLSSSVDYTARSLGFKRPKTFLCHNIKEAKEAVSELKENDEHFEGFVLRDWKNQRIKLKSADYMNLFFIKGEGVFSNKKILKILLDEADDDILSHFPEYKEDFDKVRRAFSIWLEALKKDLYISIGKHTLDRKTFAEWAKNTVYPSIIFKAYNLKDITGDWIKEQINNISIDNLLIAIGIKEKKEK